MFQTTIGPRPHPYDEAKQDVWLPHGANPVRVHGRTDSVPTPVVREHEGVGPAEVLIPVLRVAGAFPFPITDMFAPDTAATGGEVSDGRESLDIDDFQEKRARQDGSHAMDRL